MPIYYIVTNNGFLKKYYAGQDSGSDNLAVYSATLRKATIFKTIEDAKKVIDLNTIPNCLIIDQNGVIQKY